MSQLMENCSGDYRHTKNLCYNFCQHVWVLVYACMCVWKRSITAMRVLFCFFSIVTPHEQQKKKKKKLRWLSEHLATSHNCKLLWWSKAAFKSRLSGQEGPNEGCVLDVGRELFVQTAIRLHCWGHTAVIYLKLATASIQLEEMPNVLWTELEQNSTSWSRVSSYPLNSQ